MRPHDADGLAVEHVVVEGVQGAIRYSHARMQQVVQGRCQGEALHPPPGPASNVD